MAFAHKSSAYMTVLLFLWATLASSAAMHNRRQVSSFSDGFGLLAYGKGISGLPVILTNGAAYIGNASLIPNFNDFQNATFSPGSDDMRNGTSLSFTPSNSSNSDPQMLYIIPDSTSIEPVGYASSTNTSIPSGASMDRFTFYGKTAMYLAEDGTMQARFWATETDTEGLWQLGWNGVSTLQGSSEPVTIKRH